MSQLPEATARKATLAAAQAAEAAAQPAAEAARKEAIAAHFWKVITHWASCDSSDRGVACRDSIKVPAIGMVEEAKLVEWESALSAKGYTTAREGNLFVVGLPA